MLSYKHWQRTLTKNEGIMLYPSVIHTMSLLSETKRKQERSADYFIYYYYTFNLYNIQLKSRNITETNPVSKRQLSASKSTFIDIL